MYSEIANATGSYVFISFTGHPITVSDLIWLPLLVTLGIAEVVLNVIVLRALNRHVLNSDVSHYFIFNLAIADTCVGVFVVYNSFYTFFEWKLLTECLLRFGLMLAFNMASVLIMALMTVDRYVKVRYPFRHHKIFTPRAIVIASIVVWAFSLTLGTLPALGWNRGAHLEERECMFFGVLSESYLVVNIVIFLVPFVVMVILYSHIFYLARQHARAIFLLLRSVSKISVEASSWRSARTVGIIIGVYVVCWSPIGAYFLAVLLARDSMERAGVPLGTVLTAVAGISFINSLINPLVYAAKIPAVNAQFRRLCCRNRKFPAVIAQFRRLCCRNRKSKSSLDRGSSLMFAMSQRTCGFDRQLDFALASRRCESETALANHRVATQMTLTRCESELMSPHRGLSRQASQVTRVPDVALPSRRLSFQLSYVDRRLGTLPSSRRTSAGLGLPRHCSDSELLDLALFLDARPVTGLSNCVDTGFSGDCVNGVFAPSVTFYEPSNSDPHESTHESDSQSVGFNMYPSASYMHARRAYIRSVSWAAPDNLVSRTHDPVCVQNGFRHALVRPLSCNVNWVTE